VRALIFVLAAYTCVQGPMIFFPVFVRSHGGSPDAVSEMWVLMLLLEVPLLAWLGTGVKRLGARGVLATGVFAAGVRWTVCGFAPSLAWVYPVQILHGLVVAGLVIGGPLYVDAVVPERLRSTGQGLLAVAGMSVGGIASNLASGWLLERVGPWAPYAAGGLGALLLAALLPVLLPAPRRPPLEADEPPHESISLS
jgi:MFS family permease